MHITVLVVHLPRAEPGDHITARQPEASLVFERKKHQGAVSEIQLGIKERQICRCGECATIPTLPPFHGLRGETCFALRALGWLFVLVCLLCFVFLAGGDGERMNGSLSVRLVHSPFWSIFYLMLCFSLPFFTALEATEF